MEDGQPLCMGCAELDHLVFLPAGNAAFEEWLFPLVTELRETGLGLSL
jgi:hypothetical protein